ncbi:MAG: DUF2283 domain-containing protein [Gammaproteobacteria bacterium]|nr:DUF2283 domain-containing protein [Gammaproteobacteria bacterium]
MKMSYFDDTDTLYIEFKQSDVAETKDLDESTLLDVDSDGQIIAITVEHASERTDISKLVLSGIAA